MDLVVPFTVSPVRACESQTKSQIVFAKITPSLILKVRPFIAPKNGGSRISKPSELIDPGVSLLHVTSPAASAKNKLLSPLVRKLHV